MIDKRQKSARIVRGGEWQFGDRAEMADQTAFSNRSAFGCREGWEPDDEIDSRNWYPASSAPLCLGFASLAAVGSAPCATPPLCGAFKDCDQLSTNGDDQ